MPHITLEYTANLSDNPPHRELLLALHGLLETTAGIRPANCKSRWRRVDDWVVGTGTNESAFVHLDLRFLEGRSEKVITEVSRGALEILIGHFHPPAPGLDLQITVEVGEILKARYFKDPPGTVPSGGETLV